MTRLMYRGVCDTWSSTIRLAACRHVARYASDITRVSVRCVNQTRGTYDHGQRQTPAPFMQDAPAVISTLGTDAHQGLTSEQAAHNLNQYGPNAFTKPKPESMLSRIVKTGRRPDAHHAYDRGGHHPGRQHHPAPWPGGHADILRCSGHLLRHRPVRDNHPW